MLGKPSKLYLDCMERHPKCTKFAPKAVQTILSMRGTLSQMQMYIHANVCSAQVRSCTSRFMQRYAHALVLSCTGMFMYMNVHAQVRSCTDMIMY